MDPNLQVLNNAQYYNDNTLNEGSDGCVLGFNAANAQIFGTYFGGDGTWGAAGEGLADMECAGSQLLFGGYVRKADPLDYEPLMDAGYPAYYDFFYDWDPDQFGINQNGQDCIFAAFCQTVVGIQDGMADPADPTVYQAADGSLHCYGLDDATYEWQLADGAGRIVALGQVRPMAGKAEFRGTTCAEGIYHLLLRSPATLRSVKVLIQH